MDSVAVILELHLRITLRFETAVCQVSPMGASQLSPEEIASDPSISAGVTGMDICDNRSYCCRHRSFHRRLYGELCLLADNQYRDIHCSEQDQEIQDFKSIDFCRTQ